MNELTLRMVTDALSTLKLAIRYPDDCQVELGKAIGYLEAAKSQLQLHLSKP